MDPNDTPPPPSSPFQAPFQEGGVVLDQSKTAEASGPPIQETVVIPAGGAGTSSPPPQGGSTAPSGVPENPFIPQGVAAETPPVPVASGGGSSLPKRILMILVFLVLIGGVAVGAKFMLGAVSRPKLVTISYWGLWEDSPVLESVLRDFEAKNPHIHVIYTRQSPQQYRQRLQAAIDRGDGPDVFRFHNTWVAMLRTELAKVPATVITPAAFASTYYKVASADLVAGSAIYGIPMEIDGLGLYYNEDLFSAAGVSPPQTWEDVLNVVPKLTVKDGSTITTSAIALGTTGNIENYSDILATMMMQNGASLAQPTGKEAEETLIFYHKFSDPADPVYTWNDTLDNSIYAFATGKVAMIMAPSWRAFDIKQINPNLHFKIVPIPQLPGNTVTWASYWAEGVSAKSKNPDAAWQFLQYLTSADVETKLYTQESQERLFGEPYARVDLGRSLLSDPLVGAYISQAQTAKSFPLASRTFDDGINDQLIKYLGDAVNGLSQGSAPTAVLQTAAAGFQQVLAKYGLVSATAPPPQ
ncbi:extracellular solute-binding protein [Patescibacteria group bacterium]|nr:extracellular solute-binding protein [Patescibacteria group bacterium]